MQPGVLGEDCHHFQSHGLHFTLKELHPLKHCRLLGVTNRLGSVHGCYRLSRLIEIERQPRSLLRVVRLQLVVLGVPLTELVFKACDPFLNLVDD